MSFPESKEHWLDIEIKNIEGFLDYLIEEDSKTVEYWFFSPQNLENAVGKENLDFIRVIWQKTPYARKISLNILVIIYKHLFFKWTEEIFKNKIINLLKNLLKQYADWWEKPIVRKLFDKKENLIKEFGKATAGQIVGTLCLNQYKYDSNRDITTRENLPKDGEIIKYYKLVDKIREYLPGHNELIKWREQNHWLITINCSCCGLLIFIIILALITPIWFLILEFLFLNFLLMNAIFVIKEIKNVWCRIFIINLVLIYLNYLIIFYLPYITLAQDYLLWHIFQWIFLIILIISFSIFKYQSRYLGKSASRRGIIFFYFFSFWYLIWSIYYYFNNNTEVLILAILFLMFILYCFFAIINSFNVENIFNPEVWTRMKLIRPLKVYESLGILNDFALVFADTSGQDIKEVLKGLDLSKSINYNCKKFRIKFKTNIDHTFEIISKQKDEIFNTIIPNCPEDKNCVVLENKLEEFDQKITEIVKIKKINLTSVGLQVFEKLPYNIKIALERAERYFRIFRLYNEDSYGPSVLELAKSLEILFKILLNEFISNIDIKNYLNTISGDSRIHKELPIVQMIKNGVKYYTFGFFLKMIQETCSYPEEFKIKQELMNFLKKSLPVDLSNIIQLREITNYRNDYAHIAGEIITPEQYFNFRSLIFQIINLLRVDLSDFKINSVITSKIKMTKVA